MSNEVRTRQQHTRLKANEIHERKPFDLSATRYKKKAALFLISNFRRVLYVVCFLLGNSPAFEFYMPTFRNTLSVPSS